MTEALERTEYTYRKHVQAPYELAIEQVTAALKEEGFGVLTEIDVRATFRKKLDVEFPRYIILGACNPSLAHQALLAERELGALLPCNVIVYDDEAGGSVVSAVNPRAMLGVVQNPELDAIAEDVAQRMQRVLEAL
ncbi:MAG TPA: DUF302 domain-containing protein [Candidatus Sulfomarinibacteraceae bacterium]|nr:DUF302 domain-containing protein [Candidatus Sulfomarinibacteraceae bacterium]